MTTESQITFCITQEELQCLECTVNLLNKLSNILLNNNSKIKDWDFNDFDNAYRMINDFINNEQVKLKKF